VHIDYYILYFIRRTNALRLYIIYYFIYLFIYFIFEVFDVDTAYGCPNITRENISTLFLHKDTIIQLYCRMETYPLQAVSALRRINNTLCTT
jgi:hypothetical protein